MQYEKKVSQTLVRKVIEHWERNANAKHCFDVSLGASSCAFCQVFRDNYCNGCPVQLVTLKSYCENTPYGDVEDVYRDWKRCEHLDEEENFDLRARFRKAAQAELDFLRQFETWEDTGTEM